MKILVTGTAGFIGFYTVLELLERGHQVIGVDSINNYYEVNLKYGRLKETGIKQSGIEYGVAVKSESHLGYSFIQLQLEDKAALDALFEEEQLDAVCNLSAQAGVRYSLENPNAYIDSNIVGFMNVLEASRHNGVKNFSYASSSSV
ncbi:NAD-dependent epimerase/dehydratase family protein, partial [Idiomarina sp.]|uniref:NAD-dependent epimerase/dehydratase family protein n=1 Tax=Idiomarina sp. TaxID=1874361 RepID=UPI00258C2CEB